MAEYPKRESHFAHKTFRVMTKVCAAQEIGSDAMLLVAVILHQEDAKRYRGAVTFYNGQLMPILGFTSWGRLDRARKSAVKAGWLHYESGRKRKPGLYWGIVPKHASEVDDSPIDEGFPSTSIAESGGESGDRSEDHHVCISESGGESGVKVEGQPGDNRGASGEPPTLTLNPIPKRKSARASLRFVKPTLEELSGYCAKRKNSIDAELFFDHYESNGWKIGGKGPMKNWKAAVRTWERNGVSARASPKSGLTAIEAWAIAAKLSKYQSEFATHDPEKWHQLQDECREKHPEIYEFACKFGLKSIGEDKPAIVRGQFVKLWNDSS